MQTSKSINYSLNLLEDLENFDWNMLIPFGSKTIRILNLRENDLVFLDRKNDDALVFDIVRTEAQVANFLPVGRTFVASHSDIIRKYDYEKDKMVFLHGLFLDQKNMFYLSLCVYTKGESNPIIKKIALRREDIQIVQ